LNHDLGEPERDPVLFSFSNLVSVLRTPFLFLHLLYNELLLAAKKKKGEGNWRLVEGERAESRFSRDYVIFDFQHLTLNPSSLATATWTLVLLDVLSFGRCNIDALTLNNFFKIFLG
jgi:hypothetical protein